MLISSISKSNIIQNKYNSNPNNSIGRFTVFRGESYDNKLEDTTDSLVLYKEIEEGYKNFFRDIAYRPILNEMQKYSDKDIETYIKNSKYIKMQVVRPLARLMEISKIKNTGEFYSYLKNAYLNYDAQKNFIDSPVESIYAYGHLNDKSNYTRYSDLIYYLMFVSDYQSEDSLNKYCDFLNEIGLNKFSDFDKKFDHLKSQFNNFEYVSDEVDAIDYLMETYDDKVKLLDKALKKQPMAKETGKTLYRKINDIVDYIYMQSEPEEQEKYIDIISIAARADKFKSSGLKKVAPEFNNFETEEDRFNFYKLLSECDVTVSDFNYLCSKSIIKENNNSVIDAIYNKDRSVQELNFVFKDEQKSKDFYLKFKDAVSVGFDESINFTDYVKDLYNLTQRFNLKNQNEILKLYNKFGKTKNKEITPEELRNFVSLFKYSDSKDIEKEALLNKTTVIELLENIKKDFEKVEPQITSFVINDNKSVFSGMSSLEIYKKYKNLIEEYPDGVFDVLQNISRFNIEDKNLYKIKTNYCNALSKYFPSSLKINEFIHNNEIRFNNNPEEINYRDNCLKLFELLYDDKNPEESQKLIDSFIKTKFIVNSKNLLSNFINQVPSNNMNELVKIIINKDISSAEELSNFNWDLGHKVYFDENIFNYLKSTPDDYNLNEIKEDIFKINKEISKYSFPFKIGANNINKVNHQLLQESSIVDIINIMLDAPEGFNFIIKMVPNNTNREYKNLDNLIAKEIVKNHNKVSTSRRFDGSLQNIERIIGYKEGQNVNSLKNSIPDELIEFVKKIQFTKIFKDTPVPNLSCHAIMRIIDRFILDENSTLEDLKNPQYIEKYKDILRTIYTQKEIYLFNDSAIKIYTKYKDDIICLIFGSDYKIKTIIKKDL